MEASTANVPIPVLPLAITLDGTEQVEIVQPPGSDGTSKRTTTRAIANLTSPPLLAPQSVFANPTATASLGTSVTGSIAQVLRYSDTGSLGFGAVDLSTTAAVINSLSVPHGGTGQNSFVLNEVIIGNAGNSLFSVTPDVAGFVLTSNGTAVAPSFQVLSVTASVTGILAVEHGGIGTSSLTSASLIVGRGTASVAIISNVTSGFVLTSTGTATDPAFQLVNLSSTSTVTGALTNVFGISGVTTASNAASGIVGEYLSADATSTAALSNATVLNVTSIVLTAGDWGVQANVLMFSQTSTIWTSLITSLSTTSGTLDASADRISRVSSSSGFSSGGASLANTMLTPYARFPVSANTTVYLVGQLNFSASTASIRGKIWAWRVR